MSDDILVGDEAFFESLLSNREEHENTPHPLQEVLERLIEEELTNLEKEVYQHRFRERLSVRQTARIMGFAWHNSVTQYEQKIVKKIGDALVSQGFAEDFS